MSDPLTPGESPLELEAIKARRTEIARLMFDVPPAAWRLLDNDVPALIAEVERLRAALASTPQETCPFICVTCERWLSDAAELRQHQGWKHQILETAFLHGSTPPPTTEPRPDDLRVAEEIVKFLRSGEIDGGRNLTVDEAAERIELWFLREARATSAPEEPR